MNRWRAGFGSQHLAISDPDPWAFSKRRCEVRIDSSEDPAGRPPKAWIAFVSRVRQRGCRRLAQDDPGAVNQVRVITALSPELKELVGVVVLGEKSEENPASPNEGR
jgi:hypothetical protein